MKDRIAHIMRAKNLKATDFAALLGIQPSAVSHILAGRNNPSLEFVRKIKETFPEYNLDWIIFGTGPMTTSEPYKESFQEARKEAQNNPDEIPETGSLFNLEPETDLPADPSPSLTEDSPSFTTPLNHPSTSPVNHLSESPVKSVFVFYEDGTFERFTPR